MINFIVGILSSITAVLIIYLTRHQFGAALDFVFSRYFPKVSGKYLWTQSYKKQGGSDAYPNQKIYLYLKQIANSVKGYCEVYSGEELKRKYSVKGVISSTRILRITFECVTIAHHDFGVGLFKLNSEGDNFTGDTIALCVTCQRVATVSVDLKKIS